jgi:hypothetical protein
VQFFARLQSSENPLPLTLAANCLIHYATSVDYHGDDEHWRKYFDREYGQPLINQAK